MSKENTTKMLHLNDPRIYIRKRLFFMVDSGNRGDINDGFFTIDPQKMVIPIISTIEKKIRKNNVGNPLYRGLKFEISLKKG